MLVYLLVCVLVCMLVHVLVGVCASRYAGTCASIYAGTAFGGSFKTPGFLHIVGDGSQRHTLRMRSLLVLFVPPFSRSLTHDRCTLWSLLVVRTRASGPSGHSRAVGHAHLRGDDLLWVGGNGR